VAAGRISPGWPGWAVAAVVVLAGCTAGGYTGVAYADYAALGGVRRTEATGLGTAIMFAAVMLIPPSFGAAVAAAESYTVPDIALAVLAIVSAALLCRR
jgi:hypothetical protein